MLKFLQNQVCALRLSVLRVWTRHAVWYAFMYHSISFKHCSGPLTQNFWGKDSFKHSKTTLLLIKFIAIVYLCLAAISTEKTLTSCLYLCARGRCWEQYRCVRACVCFSQNSFHSTNHQPSWQHDQIRTSGLKKEEGGGGTLKWGVVLGQHRSQEEQPITTHTQTQSPSHALTSPLFLLLRQTWTIRLMTLTYLRLTVGVAKGQKCPAWAATTGRM